MAEQPKNTDEAKRSIYLQPHDQKSLVTAAIGLLLLATISVGWFAWRNGGMTHIDDLPKRDVAFEVDINTADWTEISALPNIGPSIAKAIIANREQFGPFSSKQDLLRVSGVGNHTVQSIEMYLSELPYDRRQRIAQRANE